MRPTGANGSQSVTGFTVPMTRKKKCVFIVNPAGRGGKSKAVWEDMAPRIQSALGSDWEVETKFTGGVSDAERISRSYVASGAAEVLVAVGGDGTVNEVVNGFFDESRSRPLQPSADVSRPKLAVLPLGTGSDFARQFDWSDDPQEFARRIRSGSVIPLDVGHVQCQALPERSNETAGPSEATSARPGTTQRAFVNIASMGMSARVANAVPPFKFLGSKLSYVLATIVAFFGHRNIDVRLEYKDTLHKAVGRSVVLPALTLAAFGNAQYFGGGMRVCPTADPRDGSLEFVSIAGYGLIDFALREGQLRSGRHIGLPRVEKIPLAEASVSAVDPSQGGACWIEADGEVVGSLPATVKCVPAVVDVLV